MRPLENMQFIDLRFSELDLPDDPKKAEIAKREMIQSCRFKFKRKAYVDYYDKTRRAPYYFSWGPYDKKQDFRGLFEWEMDGWTKVQQGIDPYWPEGCPPSADGFFTNGDLIAMKRPLLEHIEEQLRQQAMSRRGARERLERFHRARKAQGGGIPEEMFQELLGDLPT